MPGVAFTKADMFGFSIAKLLFTIVAVLAIWQGFKLFTRYQEDRLANRGKVAKGRGAGGEKPSARSGGPEDDAEEMIKCPVCETYVSAASAVSCGRDGCPYP